jgi:hypothetical protein
MSSNHPLTVGTVMLALVSALLTACGAPPGGPPPQLSGPPQVGVLVVQPQRLAQLRADRQDAAAAQVEAARQPSLVWALERGSRSGRVAFQFAKDYSGRHAA